MSVLPCRAVTLTRASRIRCSALMLLLAGFACAGDGTSPPPSARSLLLITLDTTRADHLGPYGYASAQTPTLDALAAEGVVFEQAYSAVPETLPSHTTMLTGLYPPSHGVRLNLNFKVPDALTTLAEVVEAEGFNTAAIVSAGVLDDRFNLNQGFASYQDPPRRGQLPELSAEVVTTRALEAAEDFDGGRFLLWAHYYDPHSPFEPRAPFEAPEDAEPESVELYDLEIAYMDHWLGKLLEGLDERGLMEGTAVMVVGDHGESLGEHGETYHTLYIYDATQHVPLLIRAPGIEAGLRISQAVSTVDVFATALGLLGFDPPQNVSSRVLPAIGLGESEQELRRRPIFSESMAPPLRYGWAGLQGIRLDHWLYIRAPREELYDLTADPGQEVNLAWAESEELTGMRQLLTRALESMPAEISAVDAGFDPGAEEMAELESLGYLGATADPADLSQPLEGEDPKDMVEVAEAYQLARLARRLRRLDTAEELLYFVVTADPANNSGWADYGEVLMDQRRFEEARDALEKAVSLRKAGRTLILLGSAERQLGNHGAAQWYLDDALRISPFPGEVWREIARLRLSLQDPEGAMEAYRQVLEHQPGDERATWALAQLAERGTLDPGEDIDETSG